MPMCFRALPVLQVFSRTNGKLPKIAGPNSTNPVKMIVISLGVSATMAGMMLTSPPGALVLAINCDDWHDCWVSVLVQLWIIGQCGRAQRCAWIKFVLLKRQGR